MPKSKWLIPLLFVGAFAAQSAAEPQRTVFTLENQFPRWEQCEGGLLLRYQEHDTGLSRSEAVPYLRYGVREHIAVQFEAPLVELDNGSSETGIGDIKAQLQLRAYEDIFGYPYFIPHFSVTLPTGDEDKGLGAGDPIWTTGISYGDHIYRQLSWVGDLSFRLNPHRDNQFLASLSLLWHVSEELDFLFESRFENNAGVQEDDNQVLLLGGMAYNWTRDLQMGVHAGGGANGDTDVLAQFRLSYSF